LELYLLYEGVHKTPEEVIDEVRKIEASKKIFSLLGKNWDISDC